MKSNINKLKIASVVVIGALFTIISCSRTNDDDLEIIRKFHPEDKYFKSSMVTLHYVIETSPAQKLDTIFNQISNIYSFPTNAGGIPDGRYRGSSPPDAFDYVHTAEINIKNGRITAISYDEVAEPGRGKKGDEKYAAEMIASGTTPSIAYPAMETQLLNRQDLSKLDAISGATYSLYRFKYAVTIALIKAGLEDK